MARRGAPRVEDDEDGGPAPVSASDWENLPDAAKACRELGHSWPKKLALQWFHVERKGGRARGKVVALERRLPCENGCGCIKITPYVMNGRGWPEPDPTRRSTIRYTGQYLLKREHPGQWLPRRADWGASRITQVPGLADLLGIR